MAILRYVSNHPLCGVVVDKHELSKTDFELIEKGLNALLNSGPDPALAEKIKDLRSMCSWTRIPDGWKSKTRLLELSVYCPLIDSTRPRSGHIPMPPMQCGGDILKQDDMGNATMNVVRPLGSAEIEKSSEVEAGGNIHELARGSSAVFRPGEASDVEMSSDNLAGLLRRVSEASTREIENLVGDLQALRKKLHTDGNRIQRDITEYAELTQQVMQLTKIISESVKKLPTAPSVNR